MKYLISLLIVSMFFSSCSKTETYNIEGIDYIVTPVDSSLNLLIESERFTGIIFKDKSRPYTPSLEDVIEAEKILKRCVEVDRIGVDSMEIWDGAIQELSKYNRQYFGSINDEGQKIIWINCFMKGGSIESKSEWKTKEVSVDDGGDSFFNIHTNIDTNECYGFFRNSIGG